MGLTKNKTWLKKWSFDKNKLKTLGVDALLTCMPLQLATLSLFSPTYLQCDRTDGVISNVNAGLLIAFAWNSP